MPRSPIPLLAAVSVDPSALLRELLAESGRSSLDLADATGVPASTIRAVRDGTRVNTTGEVLAALLSELLPEVLSPHDASLYRVARGRAVKRYE